MSITYLSFIFFLSFSQPKDLIHYYNGNLKLNSEEVDSLCNQILRSSEEDYLLALANYQKGVLTRKKDDDFGAFEFYEVALKHLSNSDTVDNFLEYAILSNQGVILRQHWLLDQAVEKYELAIEPAFAYSTSRGLSVKYNLGRALGYKEPEKATKILLETLDVALDENLSDRQAKVNNEIGLILTRSVEFQGAITYFEKALNQVQDKEIKAYIYQNYAHLHYEMKSYDEQRKWLEKSLELGDHRYRFVSLMDMGENFILRNDHYSARKFLLEAESLYDEQPLSEDNIKLYEWLTIVFPDNVSYLKKVSSEYKRYAQQRDQLISTLKQQAIMQLLMRLENQKKNDQMVSTYQIVAIAGVVVAIITILTWRIWWYRLRKRLGKKIMGLVTTWVDEEAEAPGHS